MEDAKDQLEEENEYHVLYWRKRFAEEVKPKLKKNWHQQLANFDPSLDSLKGANDMRAVAHRKASLLVTQRICNTAELMLKKMAKPKRRQKSLEERIKLW